MKKLIAGALCSALLASSALAASGLPLSPNPLVSGNPAYTVTVEGKELDLAGKQPYLAGEVLMVPVRALAEALGYTVTWTAEEPGRVEIDNGVNHTWVVLGEDSYSKASSTALGMAAPQPLGAAPVAVAQTTYVPLNLFTLMGDGVAVDGGAVALTPAGDGRTELPNPIKAYESIGAAQAAAGITFDQPKVPEGYGLAGISVIGGSVVQLSYGKDDAAIRFRAAAGTGDISGDYNVYSESVSQEIGGLTVTMKGEGGLVSLCLWQDGGQSYSLSLSTPMSAEAAGAMLAR